MLTYFEERRRLGPLRQLYAVRTWYLFGFVPLYRRYELLVVNGTLAKPSEEEP